MSLILVLGERMGGASLTSSIKREFCSAELAYKFTDLFKKKRTLEEGGEKGI